MRRINRLVCCLLVFCSWRAEAQNIDTVYRLSLSDAMRLAKEQSKVVKLAKQEQDITAEDLKDAKAGMLPAINANSSYQRFSKLTLFDGGFSGGHAYTRRPDPNSAAVGADAAFTLYAGGRQKSLVHEQEIRRTITSLNVLDQTGITELQVTAAYLDIIRLTEQDSVIAEQIKRAETRVKNIRTLYQNQKVTRSDVLRAELLLSNQLLSQEQTRNDRRIASDRLSVLLGMPIDKLIVAVDSTGSIATSPLSYEDMLRTAATNSYSLLKADQGILLQQNRIRATKSGNYPVVQLFGAYGFNYPNFLFFPPVDQLYCVGFVGIRVQYSISSVYHNKQKVQSSELRLGQLQLQREAIADNVHQETSALFIKYQESQHRIEVAKQSIEQAQANYKIVSAKYFNQLALLTDLLDADNLYEEARYSLIRAETDVLAYYYRLLYITGKL